METPIKNKDLHDILVQLAALQSEVLSAATKNLIYKIWKEVQKHEGDYKKGLSVLDPMSPDYTVEPGSGLSTVNLKQKFNEVDELANQEIIITFQPADWNTILKTAEGKDRDLAYAYEFDQIGVFFNNYK